MPVPPDPASQRLRGHGAGFCFDSRQVFSFAKLHGIM